VGIPHIDPDINAINVVIAPIGAIAMIKYAASLTLQIKYVMLDIAIAKYSV
jgi:hypothetical protein